MYEAALRVYEKVQNTSILCQRGLRDIFQSDQNEVDVISECEINRQENWYFPNSKRCFAFITFSSCPFSSISPSLFFTYTLIPNEVTRIILVYKKRPIFFNNTDTVWNFEFANHLLKTVN